MSPSLVGGFFTCWAIKYCYLPLLPYRTVYSPATTFVSQMHCRFLSLQDSTSALFGIQSSYIFLHLTNCSNKTSLNSCSHSEVFSNSSHISLFEIASVPELHNSRDFTSLFSGQFLRESKVLFFLCCQSCFLESWRLLHWFPSNDIHHPLTTML